MKLCLVAGACALCLALAAGAQASTRLALFPTPTTPLAAPPPFTAPDNALPNVFRPPIASRELIKVGLGEHGEVVSVEATQQLVLTHKADYRLTVPAPATDVVPGPESESSPGLRPGAILWQGFSAGRRILSARATLEPGVAAAPLPLRVEISDASIRLENVTALTTSTFSAVGDDRELARILGVLRKDPQGLTLGQSTYVKVKGNARDIRVRVVAPLRVTFRAGAKRLDFLLEGERTIKISRGARIELTVEPVPPAALLRPPRGLHGRALFDRAVEASLTLARVRQYQALLQNPDPLGPVSGRYVYRLAASPAPEPPKPAPTDEGGLAAWLVALIVAGSVAAAGGLAVLWAHS